MKTKFALFVSISLILCSLDFATPPKSSSREKFARVALQEKLHKEVPFIPHQDSKTPYGTYLSRNIPYDEVQNIKKYIERKRKILLLDRGEAHITVLSPPEFTAIKEIHPEITMQEIERFIGGLIQKTEFQVMGIGTLNGRDSSMKQTEVFFLIIQSRQLRAIRKLIAVEFGLEKIVFDPEKQDFHITLGFTRSDLHARPGFAARKDSSSLAKDLKLSEVMFSKFMQMLNF